MSNHEWEGRAIRLVEFTVDDGEPSREAFAERQYNRAVYAALQASAFYVDTGARVFDSVETIRALPNRHYMKLMAIGMEAARLNGLLPEEPPKPNGHAHDEAAGPSL
jgi:hypothetical protein